MTETVTISDVWGSRNKTSEIFVKASTDACGFPYGDSSERSDQLQNAKDFAAGLAAKSLLQGVTMVVLDETDTPQVSAPKKKRKP